MPVKVAVGTVDNFEVKEIATADEFLALDIVERLGHAIYILTRENPRLPEDASDSRDPLVFVDAGVGLTVSDVIADAIVEISRLREELSPTEKAPEISDDTL
jgi:hypothetical protein